MTNYQSEFIDTITSRGFLHQCTALENLDALANQQTITAYIGFDCTAPSLHVGSLLPIMMLRWLQKSGHKPIVLMGGGTTKIGDPSGRDESRKLQNNTTINNHMNSIKQVFAKYLTFGEGPTEAIMLNNDDWLHDLNYIDFLRDYGRHFSINRMISFDSVKLRLEREQALSFLEFNYMILQAYDFLELSRRMDCVLQMGGSDQWGNIVNGIELARRIDNKTLYGLTSPLLTTAAGKKMGKTAEGAVWLNEDMLSPYGYWQYWRNTADQDVGRFLRLFTDMPLDETRRLEALGGQEINEAKKILATEVTSLCHGAEAALQAQNTAHETFEKGTYGQDLPSLDIPKERLQQNIPAFILLKEANLVESNSAARRLIKGGGAKLNDQAISDENQTVSLNNLNDEGLIKLSAGKKRHVLLRPV